MPIFGLIGALAGLKGEKPIVPETNRVSFGREYLTSARENINLIPTLQELTSKANKAMATEQLKAMEQFMPGSTALMTKGTKGISNLLSGELPSDVKSFLERKAGEYGVSAGTGASSFTGAKGLRDLGLTSLQAFGQGLSAAQSWIAMANSGNQLNFTGLLQNPAQRASIRYNENQAQFNRDWMANQVEAMPSPKQQAAMQTLQNFDSITMTAFGGAAGGAMGAGMGGTQNYSGGYVGAGPAYWRSSYGYS